MSEKTPLTKEDLEKHLQEQIDFLEASAKSFDSGYEGEAKRLAATIRVLVYDTSNSISLLTQLNKKNIKFYDTAFDLNPGNILTFSGLIAIQAGASGARYVALLDDLPPGVVRPVDFDTWWNKIVFKDKSKEELTRKDLILIAANQDGGAHVDPKLDKRYDELSRKNSLSWYDQKGRLLSNPERPAIRQIAHEMLKSLKEGYQQKR